MDETYLLAAARYIEMNPVRAHLAPDAVSWRWSSARAHLGMTDDQPVKIEPLLEIAGDWRILLDGAGKEEDMNDIRKHERTGRPLGTETFIECLESSRD